MGTEQNVLGRYLVSTIAYPLKNANTLIRIGHDPLQPYSPKSLFGAPVLGLPKICRYVKHIYAVDGLQGCYRGFIPCILTDSVLRITQNRIRETLPKITVDRDDEELSDEESLMLFSSVLSRGIVCRIVAVVVSQPLHVITVRTIAQFVGGETKYTNVFSSAWTIIKEEGVFGLFSGLLPRLIGDLLIYTSVLTGGYLVRRHIVRNEENHHYIDKVISYLASGFFYSFSVVESCMAVTCCGLAAGSPPNMPHYHDMRDCWEHLHSINQLKRGFSHL